MSKFNYTKKLSAVLVSSAVLGTLSANAAANDGKPSLYGLLHVSLESRDFEGASAASAVEDRWVVNSNASRIGIKGALDLNDGGNLQAIYQAEYGVNVSDNNGSPFSQRNIFVGLKSNSFGTVTFGHNDTPFKTAGGRIEQFSDLPVDLGNNIIGGENRVNNLISYHSPKFANININLAFAPGEGRLSADGAADGKAAYDASIAAAVDPDAPTSAEIAAATAAYNAAATDREDGVADAFSASVVFDNKTIYAALAYDGNQPATRSFDGLTGAVGNAGAITHSNGGDGGRRVNAILAVGKLTIKGIEVGALVQQSKGADDVNKDQKDTSFAINGAYTIDKFKIKLQYAQSEGDVSKTEATLLGLGAEYAFGKQTTGHVFVAQGTRENKAASVDLEDKSFGVGLIHRF